MKFMRLICDSNFQPLYLQSDSLLTALLGLVEDLLKKKVREVQGVPHSQTTALPRPQEEEETDKSKQAQTEQTYEKH